MSATSHSSESSTLVAVGDTGGCQPRHSALRAARWPLWGTQGDVSHITQLREQHVGRCGGHRGMSATSPSSESSTLAAVGDTGGCQPRHPAQIREQHVGRCGGWGVRCQIFGKAFSLTKNTNENVTERSQNGTKTHPFRKCLFRERNEHKCHKTQQQRLEGYQ